jgi:branched-chain amino acid transport system permease protein
MFYREAGQFKTSYAEDQAIFPLVQDQWGMIALLVVAFVVVPLVANDYWLGPILTQFLVFALAALGLNILTGYAGQLSLGTGGFMAVGAYATYNLALRFPELPLFVDFIAAGLITAAVGIVFGLPSLRIKGFYVAVATLAAQFFLTWLFDHVGWFTNYDSAGVASAPPRTLFGRFAEGSGPFAFLSAFNPLVSGPLASRETKYLVTLTFVVVLALMAKNMTRGAVGRSWMAIRDMDVAAEVIGIRPLYAKLSAFAVSSFYAGVAGALWGFIRLGAWEPLAFNINLSLNLLFMIIIGGMGSLLGSYFGAAFIVILPLLLNQAPGWFGVGISTALASHLEAMIFGSLIVFFLIVEPHGLARLWAIGKEKLRLWPFPH